MGRSLDLAGKGFSRYSKRQMALLGYVVLAQQKGLMKKLIYFKN